ncbi:helix-turn-helix domain-containing protein [Archaeoglobus neptunius]|uniref:helix-turn-helix domain-containing protein n=1 Tax=Archaeoglobus neptunius TaxID=2798580 RepID=UPI0019251E84
MIDVEALFERRPDGEGQKILKVISRSGMSNILFSLDKAPLRFSQLMFETKLNPGILDRHLKALMQLNIVDKNSDSYELTESGKRLVRVLEQLFSIV